MEGETEKAPSISVKWDEIMKATNGKPSVTLEIFSESHPGRSAPFFIIKTKKKQGYAKARCQGRWQECAKTCKRVSSVNHACFWSLFHWTSGAVKRDTSRSPKTSYWRVFRIQMYAVIQTHISCATRRQRAKTHHHGIEQSHGRFVSSQ